jgi:hypothetical protein
MWKSVNNLGPGARIPAFLAVDAITFKSFITIQEDGSVEGMEDVEDARRTD